MKEITKKFIESGVVDKTMTRMLERWGLLDPSEIPNPETAARETLDVFIEELELLLQPEALERKEVALDPLLGEVFDPTKGH